jgi:hypothetical protein
MTSKIFRLLCTWLVLFSTQVFSKVAIFPVTGLNLTAYPDNVSQGLISFLPDASETTPVYYQLSSFSVNGVDVDKSKLKLKNYYTNGFSSLDRYRAILSGKEKSNLVATMFEFKPSWYDAPGVYSGLLTANINANERINSYKLEPLPEVPIQVVVSPKTSLSLSPAQFSIDTSSFNTPIIREVTLSFASNKPRWSLYISAENLIKTNDKKIVNDRVYVRIKDNINPKSWISLDRQTKLLSGQATPPKDIATLEFMVDSKRIDKAGYYLGRIKFFVSNE